MSTIRTSADKLVQLATELRPTPGQQDARVALDYYENRQATYIEPNPDEDINDFRRRLHVTLNITAAVVDLLAGLYERPQRRQWPSGRLWGLVRDAWEHYDVQSLLHEADRMAQLHGWCMLHVYWDDMLQLPAVRLLRRDVLEVATEPTDPGRPVALAVADPWPVQQSERWAVVWTDTDITTVTADSVTTDPNPYGMLPFVPVRYRPVVHQWDTPGVGGQIVPANRQINKLLTEMAHAVIHQSWPQRWVRNPQPGWRPVLGPTTFIEIEGDGEVGQLAAELPVRDVWEGWIEPLIRWSFAVAGVPVNAIRVMATEVRSGVQVIAERAPLLDRQNARRPYMERVERRLVWLMAQLTKMHTSYSDPLPDTPRNVPYSVQWDNPRSPVLSYDVLQEWEWLLAHGLMSPVDAYMAMHPGTDRDTAIRELERIREETAAFGTIMPELLEAMRRGNA